MYSLLNVRRIAAALLSGSVMIGVYGVEALNRSGSEYRILSTLPGDQVQTQLALGSDGGFLVTQDNSVDGNGLGIRARRIFGDLSAAQNTFQVNAASASDQQNPRVSLLRDGGAVFAWEASTGNGRRVMLRFLNSENVFSGDDILASRLTRGSQSNPALAVLASGNVVVVWAEWDRDGSMDGIFGQLFTPTGVRSGGTFGVNIKTS